MFGVILSNCSIDSIRSKRLSIRKVVRNDTLPKLNTNFTYDRDKRKRAAKNIYNTMFQIRNVIPRHNNGGTTTQASVALQSPIAMDHSASTVPNNSTIPYRHGSTSRLIESDAVATNPIPDSHHHYHHLLHMRLRCLGASRQNDKLHNDCVICTEAFAVNDVVCQLPCGHIHHSECILKWLDTSQKDTCPICRQSISETPSTVVAGIRQTNDVDDKDGFFDYESRRRQQHHNFDLIMRRVLRAREEQRLLYTEATTNSGSSHCSHDNDVEDQDVIFHETESVSKLASSNHTRRTSISSSSACSSDWLADDLEELLNGTINDDEDIDNNQFC
jgi:hypothetical protein